MSVLWTLREATARRAGAVSYTHLTSVKGFPEGCEEALELKGMVFDRPLDKNIEKIRKAVEEEHDLIMIGEESIDDGLKNMTERVKEIREANP